MVPMIRENTCPSSDLPARLWGHMEGLIKHCPALAAMCVYVQHTTETMHLHFERLCLHHALSTPVGNPSLFRTVFATFSASLIVVLPWFQASYMGWRLLAQG